MVTNILIVLSALSALLAVRWVFHKTLAIAKLKNIVDNPDARKLQKTAVPVLGGVAVFFGFIFGVFMGCAALTYYGTKPMMDVLPVVMAMMVMIYVGTIDDIIGLRPRARFFVEIVTVLALIYSSGGCIDSLHGLWGINEFSKLVAVPLTVFACVGIINSINMIDGVNGLSSGLCIAYCVIFGCAFMLVNDHGNTILAFSAAAALLPFFVHNVFGGKTKMFIGDSGTMMLGMLISWFVICLLRSDSRLIYTTSLYNFNIVALALAILSVPIADTLRVMVTRMLHGTSPFKPDKKHLHHAFIQLGVSHAVTTLVEVSIDISIVAIWYIATVVLGVGFDIQLYVVIAAAILFVWGTYFFIQWHSLHHTKFMHWLTHLSLATQVGEKNWWLAIQRRLDAKELVFNNENGIDTTASSVNDRFANIDPNNLKALDRKKIIDFMKGKAEVFVDDIKERSGAEALRVDAILFEEVRDGYVMVVKHGAWGEAEIVTLV